MSLPLFPFPKDWKDLEIKASNLLSDLGYTAEIQKNISLLRGGDINIDVYAKNNYESPNQIVLCECKYWTKNIPQSEIFAFRTVMSEIGANAGYFISRNGFQKGSIDAVKSTNIFLFTWDEFENAFKQKWLNSILSQNDKIGRSLVDFVDGYRSEFCHEELMALSIAKQEKYYQITKKYQKIAFLGMRAMYTNLLSGDITYLDVAIEKYKELLDTSINSYSDYFYYLRKHLSEGLIEIDQLFEKKLRKNSY